MKEEKINKQGQSLFSIQELQRELNTVLSANNTEASIGFFKKIEGILETLSDPQTLDKNLKDCKELLKLSYQCIDERKQVNDEVFLEFASSWRNEHALKGVLDKLLQELDNEIDQLEHGLHPLDYKKEDSQRIDLPGIFYKLIATHEPSSLARQLKQRRSEMALLVDTEDGIKKITEINACIDDYNSLLNRAIFYDTIFTAAWTSGLQGSKEIKKIDPEHVKKGETYSTASYLDYGFEHNIQPFLNFWDRNSHIKEDFDYVQMMRKDNQYENKLSQIDPRSKLYIHIHGGAGSSVAQTDSNELGFRSTISYQDLAKEIVESLTQEQLNLLTNKASPTYLRIRLVSCHAGEGSTPDGRDSFAAQLHRYLKEHYGIYSEIVGSINPTSVSDSGLVTVKYGYEKEEQQCRDQKQEVFCEGEKIFRKIQGLDVENKSTSGEVSKYKELYSEIGKLNEKIDSLRIRKQAGSTVIYKWDSNGEQIREDKKMGGIWRANVYQTLIHCIKTTSAPKKRDGLYVLLNELDKLPNEEGMLSHLKLALDQKEDTYGIKEGRSKILGFFDDRSETYHKISALIQEKEAVLTKTNENTL